MCYGKENQTNHKLVEAEESKFTINSVEKTRFSHTYIHWDC